MASPKIAFVGNPIVENSSLFNLLTGLNQKVGNFPGVNGRWQKCAVQKFLRQKPWS
ncbi:MAG: hypothetical protein IPL22_19985 [Bacteroidetes bacterium]|nr:hypothetical protein [Bacteroidota bacterium]